MLNALYRYAAELELAAEPGFSAENIKAYIWLSSHNPEFVELYMGNNVKTTCPDVGNKNISPDCSHVLFDYPIILFPKAFPQVHEDTVIKAERKHRFFMETLQSAAVWESLLSVCVRALETSEIASAIIRKLNDHNIRPDKDLISFRVDNVSILELESVRGWWRENRKALLGERVRGETLCLISGQPAVPHKLPKLAGLTDVGAQGKVPLFSFNKRAYESYGLQKEENAPVSEEAISAVNAALNALIAEAPPAVANIKFIHWFSRKIPPEQDLFLKSEFSLFGLSDNDAEEKTKTETSAVEYRREVREAKESADSVVNSIWSGEYAAVPEDTRYYILLLSGVKGRVMIRRFEEGNYYVLRENLNKWREELKLCNPNGTALVKPCKLTARLLRLLSYADSREKNPQKLYGDKLKNALSGVTADIIHAIMTGNPLPDAVAVKALAYIRSQMLSGKDDSRTKNVPDAIACQWLKVWLIRKLKEKKQEVWLMEDYNMNSPSIPYHCGGAMAVLVEIQHTAMPNVNASIVERFFSSAMQTPALVIGRLARMSNHHLGMIENHWLADRYRGNLREVFSAMQTDTLPATLKLDEQSSFAVGYYQMGAKLSRERYEQISASKARKAAATQKPNPTKQTDPTAAADSQVDIEQLTINV